MTPGQLTVKAPVPPLTEKEQQILIFLHIMTDNYEVNKVCKMAAKPGFRSSEA